MFIQKGDLHKRKLSSNPFPPVSIIRASSFLAQSIFTRVKIVRALSAAPLTLWTFKCWPGKFIFPLFQKVTCKRDPYFFLDLKKTKINDTMSIFFFFKSIPFSLDSMPTTAFLSIFCLFLWVLAFDFFFLNRPIVQVL